MDAPKLAVELAAVVKAPPGITPACRITRRLTIAEAHPVLTADVAMPTRTLFAGRTSIPLGTCRAGGVAGPPRGRTRAGVGSCTRAVGRARLREKEGRKEGRKEEGRREGEDV